MPNITTNHAITYTNVIAAKWGTATYSFRSIIPRPLRTLTTWAALNQKNLINWLFKFGKWCIARHIWLSAVHIDGRLNTGADEKSRVFSDNHEWMLNKQLFDDIL